DDRDDSFAHEWTEQTVGAGQDDQRGEGRQPLAQKARHRIDRAYLRCGAPGSAPDQSQGDAVADKLDSLARVEAICSQGCIVEDRGRAENVREHQYRDHSDPVSNGPRPLVPRPPGDCWHVRPPSEVSQTETPRAEHRTT